MDNQSSISEFRLLEFSEIRELQILQFLLFLILYLAIASGNLLIISAVVFDHHLHTPMYFFLMILAIQDLGSVSAIIPKSMANSVNNTRLISYSGCVVQFFSFVFFEISDVFLLTVMACDRYVAICNPLQYVMVMNRQVCAQMVAGVWFIGLCFGLLHTGGTFSASFCSNIVNQFYCDIPQLVKISCNNSYLTEVAILAITLVTELGGFVFIIVTYVLIFTAVLRIPSAQGRKKAFSTCLPHLTVFSVFTGWFAYLRPPSSKPSILNYILTAIYSFVPPLLNPVIYSMRNKDIKVALAKLLASVCSFFV
ncbi:olfactory receptor 14A16-like [Podarcis muralis]